MHMQQPKKGHPHARHKIKTKPTARDKRAWRVAKQCPSSCRNIAMNSTGPKVTNALRGELRQALRLTTAPSFAAQAERSSAHHATPYQETQIWKNMGSSSVAKNRSAARRRLVRAVQSCHTGPLVAA